MKLKKAFSLAAVMAVAAAVALGATACSSVSSSLDEANLITKDTLTVGSDYNYNPWTYLDENDQPAGIEKDMLDEICDRLGVELYYLPDSQDFKTLTKRVAKGGQMDVACAAITPNTTDSDVNYTDPYYCADFSMVVTSDSDMEQISDIPDNATIGVVKESVAKTWAKDDLGLSGFKNYDSVQACFDALQDGQVDCVLVNTQSAKILMEGDYSSLKFAGSVTTGIRYAIAVAKDNTALEEALNETIAAMQEDGTMDEILEEHGIK